MDTDEIVAIGGGIIALAILAVVAGQVVGAGINIAGEETRQTQLDIRSGDAKLPFGAENLSRKQSLGDALSTDGGADSGLSSGGGVRIGGDSELCTHVRIDAIGANQTVATADGELWIEYAGNRSNATWVGAHYNRNQRVTYDVTAPAATPGDFSHVCVRADSATGDAPASLTLAVNATDQTTVAETGSHTLDAHAAEYSALDGALDETRVYDRTLTPSERSTLYNTPTHPLESGAEARIMYDAYDATPATLPVYFTGQEASVAGSLVDGFDGQNLRQGGDYRVDGNRIVAQDGGRLDRAPTVFLTYDGPTGPFVGVLRAVSSIGGTALVLLSIGLLVIAASVVMRQFEVGY